MMLPFLVSQSYFRAVVIATNIGIANNVIDFRQYYEMYFTICLSWFAGCMGTQNAGNTFYFCSSPLLYILQHFLWYHKEVSIWNWNLPSILNSPIPRPVFNGKDKHAGGHLNKKDGLTRYGDSHVKDKTS